VLVLLVYMIYMNGVLFFVVILLVGFVLSFGLVVFFMLLSVFRKLRHSIQNAMGGVTDVASEAIKRGQKKGPPQKENGEGLLQGYLVAVNTELSDFVARPVENPRSSLKDGND